MKVFSFISNYFYFSTSLFHFSILLFLNSFSLFSPAIYLEPPLILDPAAWPAACLAASLAASPAPPTAPPQRPGAWRAAARPVARAASAGRPKAARASPPLRARGRRDLQQADAAALVGMAAQEVTEGLQPLDDALRVIEAVDPDHQLALAPGRGRGVVDEREEEPG